MRLRSELAQLAMRLQSWMLASREAELCSWVVAQRSLVRTASSASCNTGWMAAIGGVTGGRAGGRAAVAAGGEGEGTAGGGRTALPPAAAPSQCSGLGWGTVALAWLLLGPPLSSGAWDGAGDWAASCLSLTWDNAACAFRAERSGDKGRKWDSKNIIYKKARRAAMKERRKEKEYSEYTRVVLVNIRVQLLTWDTVVFLLFVLEKNCLETQKIFLQTLYATLSTLLKHSHHPKHNI